MSTIRIWIRVCNRNGQHKILSEKVAQKNPQNYRIGRFSTDVYPAALAIAIHDKDVINQLPQDVSLEKMPLGFLLIYCNLVQEFGRSEGEDVSD